MPRVDRANFIRDSVVSSCKGLGVLTRFLRSSQISSAVLQWDLQTYQIKPLNYLGAGRQPTQSRRV